MKRLLSLVCVLALILLMVPVAQRQVHAVEAGTITGHSVNGLTVSHGQLMQAWLDDEWSELDDYEAENPVAWNTGAGLNAVTIQFGGDDYGNGAAAAVGFELTFTNELDAEATLAFQYTIPDDCLILGATGGSFETTLGAGESVIFTVFSPEDTSVNELKITNITLVSAAAQDVTTTFQPAQNGSYTVNGNQLTSELVDTQPNGTTYQLVATPAEGYQFFGWNIGGNYAYESSYSYTATGNVTIYPVFVSMQTAIFGVDLLKFQSLTEADAYASSQGGKTIVLLNSGTITGSHTVSAGNTLLIPYDAANTVHTTAVSVDSFQKTNWTAPQAFRTLTMAADAKITVEGALNVGGMHSAGPWITAGTPTGDVGMIQMVAGSEIVVANGGALYCWGYIYGGGHVLAKYGAEVHENIQFADFRGGNATAGIAQTFLVFPMSQYYVQNIEVSATYEYGSVEHVWGSIYMSMNSQVYGTSVQFIGADPATAMFVPGVDGSVTKTYIPATDRLQIDVDGNGSINPMTLIMEGSPFDSDNPLNTATFVLPLTNNMTININSGVTTVNQSLALLPGVELNIAEGAVVSLATGEMLKNDAGDPVFYTGGYNLIVYDRDQWLKGFSQDMELMDTYYVYNGKRLQPVAFSVTGTYTRTEADLVDAVLNINGTLITDGFLYTTVNPDMSAEDFAVESGGAAIISTGSTGKIVMNNGCGQDMVTMLATQNGAEPVFTYLFMVSGRLLNGDGSYLDTLGAEAGATFIYCERCDAWHAEECTAPTAVEITWIVGNEVSTQEFDFGAKVVYGDGTAPTKASDGTFRYVFIGWSTDNDNTAEYTFDNLPAATEDAVYYACFAAYRIGDLDLDDDVDADDLTLLASHVAKIDSLTGEALLNADVDFDGDVDADDMTQHARYVAKIIADWNE